MFLNKAHICVNCEWLGEDCMGCDKCGSREVMPVTRWFEPTIVAKEIKLTDAQIVAMKGPFRYNPIQVADEWLFGRGLPKP